MKIRAVNNRTGEEQFFEVRGSEMLIGSDAACDAVLTGDGVFPQHARLVRVSHHIFLRTARAADGTVKAFHENEPNEDGHYINWRDPHSRIDTREFQIGDYTVCVTQSAWLS